MSLLSSERDGQRTKPRRKLLRIPALKRERPGLLASAYGYNLRVAGFRYSTVQVAGTGLEHPANSSGNGGVADESGAESGALDAENGPKDPQLTAIIDAWPTLPEPIKAGVLAIIKAAEGQHHA